MLIQIRQERKHKIYFEDHLTKINENFKVIPVKDLEEFFAELAHNVAADER